MKPDPVLLSDIIKPVDFGSAIELFTIEEVARLLKISVSGVRRFQQGRHIPFLKIGGSIRFARSDIVSYLEKQRVESIG